jgi:hypothetical protein
MHPYRLDDEPTSEVAIEQSETKVSSKFSLQVTPISPSVPMINASRPGRPSSS